MKKLIKWIIYVALTLVVIRLIPFSQLSDFVAEKIPSKWVGEGEDAYNNIDMIAIVMHIIISVIIVYILSKLAFFLTKKLRQKFLTKDT